MIDANRLSIRLPEGVEFSLRLAGPLTRFLACVIDLLCIFCLSIVVGICLSFFEGISRDFAAALGFLVYFAIALGYSILLEWAWRGQTLGKKALKLRVMDASGLRLKFGQIFVRNLLRFVDMLPGLYLLGGTACLFSPKSQRLGDLAANTIVVRQSEPPQPEVEKLMQGKFNSLRAHPHLAARLRGKVEPAQAAVLLQTLLRRDEFTPQARLEIFAMAAEDLRRMVPFPVEITESLSDEAFVRSALDVIYRPRG